MGRVRAINTVLTARPTVEGAGVRVRRAFGQGELPRLDPFLLLDHFGSDDPADWRGGFPSHPHRGIETITYVLAGHVDHGDSLGSEGSIGPGDVQWMTAGSGIIHREMPRIEDPPRLRGLQLWANLPAAHKMVRPRYRAVAASEIPVVRTAAGGAVRVVAGAVNGARGPVSDVVTEPIFLDVTLPAAAVFGAPVPFGHTAFAYVLEGEARVGEANAAAGSLVLFGDGDEVEAAGGESGARLILVAGKPIGEPVAWWGPIVMNTAEELQVAFDEYQRGTFLRHGR
jgi:redox-sensitive bicupin YhaK (pirin superfamily)